MGTDNRLLVFLTTKEIDKCKKVLPNIELYIKDKARYTRIHKRYIDMNHEKIREYQRQHYKKRKEMETKKEEI